MVADALVATAPRARDLAADDAMSPRFVPRARTGLPDAIGAAPQPESLFERLPWLYALFREHAFRDDTARIAAVLWPLAPPPPSTVLLEVGCGPGTYARRLARRYADLDAIGVDRSARQVAGARSRAAALGLVNCRFERDDVLGLRRESESVDAVVATRLLMILRDPERALAEMHRVLRPGGRCFIAEPCSRLGAALPLTLLRLAVRMSAEGADAARRWIEPAAVAVLAECQFATLVASPGWARIRLWRDGGYRYALCEKRDPAAGSPVE